MNDTFMELLKVKDIKILEENDTFPGMGHGIGRIGTIEPVTLEELIIKLKESFSYKH